MRIDEAEAAGKEEESFKYIGFAVELADHGAGDAGHADDSGAGSEEHAAEGGTDAEYLRREDEYIWNDEGSYAQFRCIHPGLQRVTAGNGRSCVGSQGYRRGNVGDNAEVEYKHMSRQDGYAQLDEGRCSDSGGNDVVGRGRHAHAQNEGGEHGAEKQKHEVACCHGNQSGSQFQTYAGFGNDTDNHAGGGAGDDDAQGASGTFDEAVYNVIEVHAGAGPEHGAADGNKDACQGCFHGGVAGGQEGNDGNKRNSQMAFFFHNPAPGFQLASGGAFQVVFLGFEMNAQEYAQEVKDGGNHGGFDDFHVGDAYEFSHEEGSGTHNRRHELPAGGCGCFYGAGEVFVVAQFLHHRNGEGAGTYYVGYGRAGNGTLKGTGDDRYFSRSAGGPAGQGIGNIDEKLAKACFFQVSAEEDEEEDEGGRYAQRNTEYAFGGEEEVSYHLVDGESSVCQRPGHVGAQEAIKQEAENYDDDRKAYDTAGSFQYHHNTQESHHGVGRCNGAGAEDELLVVHQDVYRRDDCQYGEEDINRMESSALNPGFLRRAEEEYQRYAEGQVDAALDHGVQCTEDTGIYLEERKADAEGSHDLAADACIFHGV